MPKPKRNNRYFKGFIYDAFVVGVSFLALALVTVLFALLWINSRPYYANALGSTSAGYNAVARLGNNYFLNTGDTVLIFFYFMMILASFINAMQIGADPATLPIGIPMMIVGILVSMPISDMAVKFMTYSVMLPASHYYLGTLYILENLPILTALATLGYIVFVVTRRNEGYVVNTGGGNVVNA